LAAKEEVINTCWSQDPVHANLHTYFKLASNTIQIIERGTKTDTPSGKRQRATSSTDSQSGTGSGSGSGSGDGNASKKQKTFNKIGYPSGNQHGGQVPYGVGGFGGGQRPGGGGGRHDNCYDNRYDSGGYCAVALSDRGETITTVRRRHTTMVLGETPEGGDSKDAAPTAAAAAAAANHRQCSPGKITS
jgi:hypothetical protein